MSSHTPGPWYFSISAQNFAVPKGESLPYEEQDANARLIKAAPQMLQACNAAENVLSGLVKLNDRRGEQVAECLSTIRAAIAAATGQKESQT